MTPQSATIRRQGSRYDQTGALREWWTPQDRQRFNALTALLVEQYNLYEPLPGHRIQGALTLGENIADLAGLTVAYDAYQMALGGRPAPVLDGLTGDQRFYLGWAPIWRRSIAKRTCPRLLTDRTPSQERAVVVAPRPCMRLPANAGGALSRAERRVRIW